MKNVLITGVSGYIGSTLAGALCADETIETVLGIDIRRPAAAPEKIKFFEHDVRQPMTDLMTRHGVDTVVHAAYVLPPLHDTDLMESINVEGTRNVLESSARAAVRRLLVTSSATAYGFHPDNPVPLTETDSLRGNKDFTYAKNKREIKAIIAPFAKRHPDIAVSVLGPCFVVGPTMDNPLSNHLKKCLVVLPKETSPLQLVHETDLMRAILHCLKNDISGTFNIAGAGTITVADMVRLMGNRPVWVPSRFLYPLNRIAWALRLHFFTRFPSAALGLFRYLWVVSPKWFIEKTGFSYEFDSRTAFEDFARFAGR
ncbi:NAD-dependent epimerase/dehydratase family protein [uncultured Desulfosarcina sp.]|uniref:NAD-dependent epimerase/dehydratase family protein n=1 Tax=uncultured Desulfosarcina sp. TaxID=218289 RepID=UPI0029C691E1|nr:NAD-dependent epimerase/dehydratase family protein [uncultured Desulfosarcina sp.]